MNCKPTDMARIVAADSPKLLNAIVYVARPASNQILAHWGPLWWCKPAWAIKTFELGRGRMSWSDGDELIVPDCDLRPIRPEADPVTTDCDVGVEA